MVRLSLGSDSRGWGHEASLKPFWATWCRPIRATWCWPIWMVWWINASKSLDLLMGPLKTPVSMTQNVYILANQIVPSVLDVLGSVLLQQHQQPIARAPRLIDIILKGLMTWEAVFLQHPHQLQLLQNQICFVFRGSSTKRLVLFSLAVLIFQKW